MKIKTVLNIAIIYLFVLLILYLVHTQQPIESSFPESASTQINTPAKIPIYDSQEYRHPSNDTIEGFTQEVTG